MRIYLLLLHVDKIFTVNPRELKRSLKGVYYKSIKVAKLFLIYLHK